METLTGGNQGFIRPPAPTDLTPAKFHVGEVKSILVKAFNTKPVGFARQLK